MNAIFYGMAVLFIMYELYIVFNPEFFNIKSKNHYLIQFGYLVWCIVGLASSQWMLFLILLLMGSIGGIFRYVAGNNSKYNLYITRVDAIASAALLIKILVHHFTI